MGNPVMTNEQMTKTVDLWTEQEKQDLIEEVKSLVDSECIGYTADDVIQVVLVGSYVWGTPTAESDVDVLVEVPLREYKRFSGHSLLMADGKRLSIQIRDRLKTPRIDQKHRQTWDLSRYSLTNNELHVGADNEAFDAFRKAT